MSDIDVNKIQQNVKELQDQNAIDFQQWKKLWKNIEKLSEKIKLSDNNLNILMKKIKNDYEKLKKIIVDENVQVQLNNKIEDNKNKIEDNKSKIDYAKFKAEENSNKIEENVNKIENNIIEINKKVNTESFDKKVSEINSLINTIDYKITRKYTLPTFGANIWLENNYTQETLDKIVERATKVGFNSFLITCYNTLDLENKTIIQTISNETIIRCINSCKKYNVENIALKCHISPNSSNNITSIPNIIQLWKNKIENYANLAYEHNVNTIFISNEQINLTSTNREQWDYIIDYCHIKGLKCFSSFANFNDFYSCCFIDLVDGIGINYYPTVVSDTITKQEVIKNFDGYEGKEYSYRFKAIKNAFPDKKLIISEIGICNNEQALLSPSKYQFDSSIPINENIQSLYYESFLQELSKDIGIDGLYVWSIGDSQNRTNNSIFSPLWNEVCEKTIKDYMGVNENDL